MLDFQIISAIIFIVFLTVFLWIKRKNIEMQKFLFPLLYFVLYRTKIGLKFMKKTAKRHPRFLRAFANSGIVVGFIGMIFIVFELFRSLFRMFMQPEAPSGVAPVLPVPVDGAIYVPFFYWILCIFIIAFVHEFSHGFIARLHKIRIKSSGFAFLGVVLPVIPAAFVEPDEEQLEKKKAWQQLGVFAAGPFSNIILGIIALVVILFVINPIAGIATENTGILIDSVNNNTPAMEAGVVEDDLIYAVDNTSTRTIQEFTEYVDTKDPGDTIMLQSNRTTYSVRLGESPTEEDKPYLGIMFTQDTKVKEEFTQKYGEYSPKILYMVYDFFFWLYLLNIGIGLFNLVPLGPIDGGRMVRVVLLKIFDKKRAEKIWKNISLVFLGIILYMLFSPWLKSIFF